ncbi:MAG: DUF2156 domain-containing protein [Deltaproteobacteria bacterium]|nr:DUF2156 domain-containing protein [Deltaproteobacteria bacterium]
MRPALHPLFSSLDCGISEFAFANIYLFREAHAYGISRLKDNLLVITGSDNGKSFFMLPFGLPGKDTLNRLFERFSSMKCVSEEMAGRLKGLGCNIMEDRDNFDYIYSREEMASLSGRKFHRRKNLVNAFMANHSCEARPLLEEYRGDALALLDRWRRERGALHASGGDYAAAKEALERMDTLQLCGGIYYVEGRPAAYTLGEELGGGKTFAIHFEKGVGEYKGLMQFVSQAFASILPEKYGHINREQDLGIEGLRKAKLALRPSGFVRKYRAGKAA